MSLLSRMRKNSTIKETDVLSESKFFSTKDMIQTAVPMVNVALSGRLDGGLTPGLTVFAGPSKHFKTAFCMLMAKAYLDKYKDAVLLFYDSEFGSPQTYFESFGIDTTRVLHSPVTDIEVLKYDLMNQLDKIERGDHIIIIVDSIGNLASRKEVEDALEGKAVADMTRAKQLKSLFRMCTPHLTLKNIPMVVVNHTYKEMGMYPKDIVSGGQGPYLSADNIFIIGRQQEKDGTDVVGYNFIINVEKSRHVREKSKIPVEVLFDGGINTWSGLIDVALEANHVIKDGHGFRKSAEFYDDERKYKYVETNTKEFWLPILRNPQFSKWIQDNYVIAGGNILSSDFNLQAEYEDATL
jgi:RecA/RadA recombinase